MSPQLRTLALSALLPLTAAAQTLIPTPRELHTGPQFPVLSATVTTLDDQDTADLFTARDLTAAFTAQGIPTPPNTGLPDLVVTLLRASSPEAKHLLAESKLTLSADQHDEGYALITRPHQAFLIADTSAGLFYAAQTLKQLLEAGPAGPSLWTATIRDWPAMKYRGLSDDISRGPFPTLAFQQHQIQTLASYKVNLYSPYFEHTLQYANDPLGAPPGSSLTRAESQQLAAFAAQYHVTIVPEQEAFGHLHHILQYEKYSTLAETPHGHVLAPGEPGTQPLIASWFSQIAQDFPSPFLHVGADETFELGTGRTQADVDKRGLGPVYADFLSQIHTTLSPLNRRLLFWGDVATSDPSAIAHLPKDMIAIPWIYWHEDSYDHNILPFKQAGIETWVAPGDANWNLVYPLGDNALDNISGFVESGQRLGSTGVLNTVWNDDAEGLFNQDWFGVVFGAAAGWQPGRSPAAPYRHAFPRLFFGDTSGKLEQAQAELMLAEDAISPDDSAFWVDPWSPAGQAMGTKMRPKLHDGRLHAEHALELIEQARAANPNLHEAAVLDAMELGARRLDLTGLKFQLSEEMTAAYAKAYALAHPANGFPTDKKLAEKQQVEARELLYSISSNNGRCEDLRDAYSSLKTLYTQSWLAENRPYFLSNVQVRYDLQIELWTKRGQQINTLIDAWQDNNPLPTAAEAGLPPTP